MACNLNYEVCTKFSNNVYFICLLINLMCLILLLMTANYGLCFEAFVGAIHEMASEIQGNQMPEFSFVPSYA
jgi:hypothetical protein